MKLIILFALSTFSLLANAQKKDKFYLGIQVQPELTFYKSGYYSNTYPANKSTSSFNLGINLYGQYQITEHLFATLGLGFISRKLNTTVGIAQERLPAPYTNPYGVGPYITTKTVWYRVLQIPVGFGYNILTTKKTNVYASLTFNPNFLLNTKYGSGNPYPAFKKNYWQGFSLNPSVGLDYTLSKKIKLTGVLAYSIVNTVREDEYADKQPKLNHTYLQLGLGAKLKLK